MKLQAFLASSLALGACSLLPTEPYGDLSLEEKAARIAAETARIRDLELLRPVPVSRQATESFRAVYAQMLEEDWESEGAGLERAYRMFGLVSEDAPLKPFLVDFVPEIVAGYYDPEKKEYFVVRDEDDSGETSDEKDDGDDDDDDDDDDEFDWDEIDRLDAALVLPHELTHALEDQHFDFLAAEERLAADDDRAAGHAALVEGSAMEAGVDHVIWRAGVPISTAGPLMRRWISRLTDVPFIDLDEVSADLDDEDFDLRKVRDAPPVIQQEFLFPYLHGWGFVNRLRSEFGWRGVDAAHADPPESSEQILFPERYIDRRDRPVAIAPPSPPAGWTSRFEETLGMLRMRVLLSTRLESEAASVADGWDGDRYVVYDTSAGDALGWITAWDYEGAAEEFEVTYRALLARHELPGSFAVLRDGALVASIQSAPVGEAEPAARHLLGASVTTAPDDQAPDRWYWKVARFPFAVRLLDRVVETHLLGGFLLNLRNHAEGHRFDLVNGWILNTENNPDRASAWLAFGLLGFTHDRTIDYTFTRIPLIFSWHGRGEGEQGSTRWSLLPFRCIDYLNQRGTGEFDLLWGLLLKTRFGEATTSGRRLRILMIPIPGV